MKRYMAAPCQSECQGWRTGDHPKGYEVRLALPVIPTGQKQARCCRPPVSNGVNSKDPTKRILRQGGHLNYWIPWKPCGLNDGAFKNGEFAGVLDAGADPYRDREGLADMTMVQIGQYGA